MERAPESDVTAGFWLSASEMSEQNDHPVERFSRVRKSTGRKHHPYINHEMIVQ
jgi:hypothetical protein